MLVQRRREKVHSAVAHATAHTVIHSPIAVAHRSVHFRVPAAATGAATQQLEPAAVDLSTPRRHRGDRNVPLFGSHRVVRVAGPRRARPTQAAH